MNANKDYFQTFSDNRLIEIVKNASQFGYDDNIRSTALDVLKERGITEEDLQLTGNLSNYKYDYSRSLYVLILPIPGFLFSHMALFWSLKSLLYSTLWILINPACSLYYSALRYSFFFLSLWSGLSLIIIIFINQLEKNRALAIRSYSLF